MRRPWRIDIRGADGEDHFYTTLSTRARCEARLLDALMPGGDAVFGARVLHEGRVVAIWSGRSSGEWMPWNRDPNWQRPGPLERA